MEADRDDTFTGGIVDDDEEGGQRMKRETPELDYV
jgi:hypothetical protein